MTLRDEIIARSDCADALAARDCGAIAEILSAVMMAWAWLFVVKKEVQLTERK
jgi:diacylglycerol kinase